MTPEDVQARVGELLMEAELLWEWEKDPDPQSEAYAAIGTYDHDRRPQAVGGYVRTNRGDEDWMKDVSDVLNRQDWLMGARIYAVEGEVKFILKGADTSFELLETADRIWRKQQGDEDLVGMRKAP